MGQSIILGGPGIHFYEMLFIHLFIFYFGSTVGKACRTINELESGLALCQQNVSEIHLCDFPKRFHNNALYRAFHFIKAWKKTVVQAKHIIDLIA